MEISIVLITCDRAQQMRVAVESLLAQQVDPRWSYELIVVNDGSSDDTAAVLEELQSTASVPMRLLHTRGVGVPNARNLGARAAEGRWMACFDDDQIASPNWLQELRVTAELTGSRCVGGALALKLPEGVQVELAPRARALLGEHLLSESAGRYPRKWVPASNNVLMERELFFAVGGFDERFRQGGSDTDLFERVRRTGAAIWFAPRALAQHVLPAQRLRADYLRWTSLKVGAASARILVWRRGFAGRAGTAALRCAVAVLRDVPALCASMLAGKSERVLESRCSLWYTQGLLRGLTANLWPQSLGGARFLEKLDFRRHGGEREKSVARPVARHSA